MDTKANILALNTAITEIKNTCPGISNIFVLDESTQLLTKDNSTTEEIATSIAKALASLIEQTVTDGPIETLTCQGSDRKVNFTRCVDNYFVTMTSTEADEKTIANLTRILVPTMIKLQEEKGSLRCKQVPETPEPIKTRQAPLDLPSLISPATDFLVENLSGLSIISGSPDTIRVDRALIGQWKEMYGDRKISEATVEEIATGKKVRCKFELIKGSKLEGKGLVQIPDRIQSSLGVKKGTLVRLRPIVED